MDLKTSLLFDEIQKAGLVYFEARDVIPLAEKIGIRNGDINWRLGELAKQGKLRNLWRCRFRVYGK